MRNVQNPYQDIISDLPINIVEHILMRLPLADAVRTSILSSKWRYKWLTRPHLVFDDQLCKKPLEIEKLKTIIYQVLLVHRGPISKFVLLANDLSCSDINHWIFFLSQKHIQEFALSIFSFTKYMLPSHLFSFMHLSHLLLSHCVFKPPPSFKGFIRLVDLEFRGVDIVPLMFTRFISNCPHLERLRLGCCTSFDCLEINAPNLNFFKFGGTFKSICFQNASALTEISVSLFSADLDVQWHHEQGKDSNLIKFLCCVPAVEKLTINADFLGFLAIGDVPKGLPSSLNYLKVLDIACMHVGRVDEVSCALSLIRSSPNLQKLTIYTYTISNTVMEPVVEFLQAHEFSSCSSNKLQEVKMGLDTTVLAPALELIKLLLAYSTVLEKMEIFPVGRSVPDGSKMLKELIQYPRASPKAKVVYLG